MSQDRFNGQTPKISVILCTRNRAENLLVTLNSYEKIITDIPWELIVVNNGSTDCTQQILDKFASITSILIHVIFEPRIGLSYARNTGWHLATSEIIAFSDDDCYPHDKLIDAIYSNFSESNIGYLGGKILLYDPEDFPITIQLCEERITLPPYSFTEPGLIQGANMAFRKEVLEVTGGFDGIFGVGGALRSSEDTDLINRASYSGYMGTYDPRPIVYHHHRRRTQEQVSNLIRSYDIGRGAHYMKSVLDPTRRSQAARQWYWRTLLPALRSRRAAQKLFYEMVGIVRYLICRFIN